MGKMSVEWLHCICNQIEKYAENTIYKRGSCTWPSHLNRRKVWFWTETVMGKQKYQPVSYSLGLIQQGYICLHTDWQIQLWCRWWNLIQESGWLYWASSSQDWLWQLKQLRRGVFFLNPISSLDQAQHVWENDLLPELLLLGCCSSPQEQSLPWSSKSMRENMIPSVCPLIKSEFQQPNTWNKNPLILSLWTYRTLVGRRVKKNVLISLICLSLVSLCV